MAKTVKELSKRLRDKDKKVINDLERKIDLFLEENFDVNLNSEMEFDLGKEEGNYVGSVRKKIEKKYFDAGWNLKYVPSIDDGPFNSYYSARIKIKPIRKKKNE